MVIDAKACLPNLISSNCKNSFSLITNYAIVCCFTSLFKTAKRAGHVLQGEVHSQISGCALSFDDAQTFNSNKKNNTS